MTLRRHFLPHGTDDKEDLARAIWLAEYFYQREVNSAAEGIALAFNGK
ncbi:DUF6890 family protein [Photorhabdus tasmaniensis]